MPQASRRVNRRDAHYKVFPQITFRLSTSLGCRPSSAMGFFSSTKRFIAASLFSRLVLVVALAAVIVPILAYVVSQNRAVSATAAAQGDNTASIPVKKTVSYSHIVREGLHLRVRAHRPAIVCAVLDVFSDGDSQCGASCEESRRR